MPKMPRPPKQMVHGTRPKTIPLELLVQKVVQDLFIVWTGNGYPNVAFTLLVQDLEVEPEDDSEQPLCMGGNLQAPGMKVILQNALDLVNAAEPDAPRIALQ